MNDFACLLLPIAAVGYSMLYLLFGGGLGGAFVIFIIRKIPRQIGVNTPLVKWDQVRLQLKK